MSLQHFKEISELSRQLKSTYPGKELISLLKVGRESNTTRSNLYKKKCLQLNLSSFDKVLKIDLEKMSAWVEPQITMEELCKQTLACGLIPRVVPEFKGITVGGAINGAALESSSHRYGQFNDNCLSYELLLGNGELVRVDPQKNSDLYYGLAGSYGSLGLLTSVEMALVPALPWVEASYLLFDRREQLMAYLDHVCQSEQPPDFLEAVLITAQSGVVIEGRMQKSCGKNIYKVSRPWSKWFFQHLKEIPASSYRESIPLSDYLFRFDRGAFWMGYYILDPKLLFNYFSQSNSFFKTDKLRFHQERRLLSRCIGSFLSSQGLFSALHALPESWLTDTFIIQDFYIPMNHLNEFIQNVEEEVGLFPLWLCPIKNTDTPQLFSPHQNERCSPGWMVNVGIYGMPNQGKNGRSATSYLEKLAHSLNGRKMLYGHSYYSTEHFWEIYPKEHYQKLRSSYAAERWVSIEEKVLTLRAGL